uniref:Putative disease resistance protein At5g63020 n=1 Tax=Rhizophora mucronata TaxID=61149 RepID=A0A2P2MUN8_RHIMU
MFKKRGNFKCSSARLEDMTPFYSRNFDVVVQHPPTRPTGEESVVMETMLDNVRRWLVEDEEIMSLLGWLALAKLHCLSKSIISSLQQRIVWI